MRGPIHLAGAHPRRLQGTDLASIPGQRQAQFRDRERWDSSLVEVGEVLPVEIAPSVRDVFDRRQNVAVILHRDRKRDGLPTFDLGKKHVHCLGGGHAELVEDLLNPGLAARIDAGAQDGGFRHDTKGAQTCNACKLHLATGGALCSVRSLQDEDFDTHRRYRARCGLK